MVGVKGEDRQAVHKYTEKDPGRAGGRGEAVSEPLVASVDGRSAPPVGAEKFSGSLGVHHFSLAQSTINASSEPNPRHQPPRLPINARS